jgi:hypothetical protein
MNLNGSNNLKTCSLGSNNDGKHRDQITTANFSRTKIRGFEVGVGGGGGTSNVLQTFTSTQFFN